MITKKDGVARKLSFLFGGHRYDFDPTSGYWHRCDFDPGSGYWVTGDLGALRYAFKAANIPTKDVTWID